MVKRILITAVLSGLIAAKGQAEVGQDVAGMAIASGDRVHIWYTDGTTSVGSSRRLDEFTAPRPFSTPDRAPSSIVGMAITKSNGRVYTWYSDGHVSVGSDDDLGAAGPLRPYTLPPDLAPNDIVGMSVSTANVVFTWYANGTYTTGTATDLDQHTGPVSYSLPEGYTPADILGMATANNDQVHSYFDDGSMSIGAPPSLGEYQRASYSQSLLLKSVWPHTRLEAAPDGDAQSGRPRAGGAPRTGDARSLARTPETDIQRGLDRSGRLQRIPEDLEPEAAVEPQYRDDERKRLEPAADGRGISTVDSETRPTAGQASTAPVIFTTRISGKDPMIAAGREFLVASQQDSIEVRDRAGRELPEKNGISPIISAASLFASVLWDASGTSTTDLNGHTRFSKECNDPAFPQSTLGARACIVEAYDVRVFNNPASDRWIIIANLRNLLWTDIWQADTDQWTREYGEDTGVEEEKCGVVSVAGRQRQYTNDIETCRAARRHVGIAVSKTSDPRDGFHVYAISTNNYRDFPWATIKGDVLLVNHHGVSMLDGAVATGLLLSDLEEGNPRPSYFQYFKEDVDDHARVLVPQHGPGAGILFTMYADHGDSTHLYAFPAPTDRFTKPALTPAALAPVKTYWPAVFQGEFFHMTGHRVEEGDADNDTHRLDIAYTRLPVKRLYSRGEWSLELSTSPLDGFRSVSFGLNSPDDDPAEKWSYERPALAVTANEDVVIVYGRMPRETSETRFPDARYTVWYQDQDEQNRSSRLVLGGAAPTNNRRPGYIDHAGATVDPLDRRDVWVTHVYPNATGDYVQFVARVRP